MALTCPSCGESNGDTATMCGMCGAVLKRGAEPQAAIPATAGARAGAPAPRPAPRPAPMAPPPSGAPTPRVSAPTQQRRELVYVGFWMRFLALLIDGLVLGVILTPLSILNGAGMVMNMFSPSGGFDPTQIGTQVLFFMPTVVSAIYEICMQATPLGATVGMLAIGARLSDNSGNLPTFGMIFGRYLIKSGLVAVAMFIMKILGITMLLGIVGLLAFIYYVANCIVIGTNEYKQGIHDQMADTFVIRRT